MAAGLEAQCQWKLDILRDLRQRNKRESGGFSELIASRMDIYIPVTSLPCIIDGKLQEQLNALRIEVTRLEYQNNELDQVR